MIDKEMDKTWLNGKGAEQQGVHESKREASWPCQKKRVQYTQMKPPTSGKYHLVHSPVSDLEELFLHQSLEQAAKMPASPDLKGYYFMPMFSGQSLQPKHSTTFFSVVWVQNIKPHSHLCLVIHASPHCSDFLFWSQFYCSSVFYLFPVGPLEPFIINKSSY